ncbi:MAG: hypothetical protein FWD73_02325 [Polyangiaceae bacterium]|nr:hypothetical protein [Polyangiaceae bacterium]
MPEPRALSLTILATRRACAHEAHEHDDGVPIGVIVHFGTSGIGTVVLSPFGRESLASHPPTRSFQRGEPVAGLPMRHLRARLR